MKRDDLVKPISPDAPCGEDLLAVDDPDFVDYYFNVEDRLPTSYFNVARGTLFDSKSIDLKSETAQIDGLLKRTRDLRLVQLEARFQILAGRFKGFCDSVMAMADLIEAFPAEVHPTDPIDRRNAIEELNSVATVVAPMEYAVLFTDRRIGDVTFRPYATGIGKIAPREGEEAGDSAGILSALGGSENQKTVDGLWEQVNGVSSALARIGAVCLQGPDPFRPTLDRLEARLADLREMVVAARSDLAGGEVSEAAAPAGGEGAEAPVAGPAGTTTVMVQAIAGEVKTHRMAYRFLQGVETYFVKREPASMALVLVTQSRMLIGRPLVEALDALLESTSSNAAITFGSDVGFSIPMSRMRDLTGYAAMNGVEDYSIMEDGEDPPPDVLSRDHAGALLKQVEDFFRVAEPTSPIPILLFKARNMLTKDFHAVVRDLIPPQPSY